MGADFFNTIGAAEIILVVVMLGILLALSLIPAVLAYVVLKRVPLEHRKQEPALAFLLLIPFFSIVWEFFVHPKVAESLKSYYKARGDDSVGDCGASVAMWMCICGACTIIPIVGMLAGLASLVLLIVFYVKAFELSGRMA